METLWFVLVGFMLTMYVVLDGFDLGAGAIHTLVAKTDRERRLVLRSIGPVWDGNEVWLIAAAGTLFFTFPLLYSASFSGFYLPLMIVLWLLMVRGLAIELRHHISHPVWSGFWDGLWVIGSALLAFFYGAAVGNVVRGVPLARSSYFFEALWTDFNPASINPGILDWYTVLIGLLTMSALIMHGASFIVLKTEGQLNSRARRLVFLSWIATIVLTMGGTVATFWLRPGMMENFIHSPWGFVLPAIAVVSLAAVGYYWMRQHERNTFLASCLYLAAMMASTAFAIYPRVLPAVNDKLSLTVANAKAPDYGLAVGLVWWAIGMALALVYFVVVYRMFRGKVRLDGEGY